MTAFLSVGAYLLFARLRSGQYPDLASLGEYQRIFYVTGLAAVRMDLWEFWQPIILLHALVVAWSLRRAIWGKPTPDTAWYFFIALYGLGGFSYYQGRSHTHVLCATFFPATILGFLVAYDGWQMARGVPLAEALRVPRMRWTLIGAGLSSLVCAFGLLCFCRAIRPAVEYSTMATPLALGDGLPVLHRGEFPARYHRQDVPPTLRREMNGKKGVALMSVANLIHVATGSRSTLPVPTPHEVLLFKHLGLVQAASESDETEFVLIDPGFELIPYLDFKKFRPIWQADGLILLKPAGP